MQCITKRRKLNNLTSVRTIVTTIAVLATLISSNLTGIVILAKGQQKETQDIQVQQALLVLDYLLSEAKGYENKALKVRVKAQVADVLWPIEPERARELISLSFDEIQNLEATASSRYALRSEIVGIVRRHDPKFASELIERPNSEANSNSHDVLMRESVERITERGALYLDSADNLLRTGDQDRAVSLARRSLGEGRSGWFLSFLDNLRDRNQAAADKLFLDSLNMVRQSSADPNDVLFLGLYLFSPGKVFSGNVNGQLIISRGVDFSAAAAPPSTLLLPYLRTAAEIMDRFSVTPGHPGFSAALELKRFALQQLLPLFDLYLPERASMIRGELAQLGALAAWVPASQTAPVAERRNPSLPVDISTTEAIKSIEQITGVRERENVYFEEAINALKRKDFEKARALAAKITEFSLKLPTLELIEFQAARKAIENGDLSDALYIANSRLSKGQPALIYYWLASSWLKQGDIVRANDMTHYAQTEAAKIEDSAQRALVYIHLAAGIAKRDAIRAFELAEAAVKAINSAERFDLKDSRIVFRIRKPNGSMFDYGVSSGISLLSVLPTLAQANLLRTVDLARSLSAPEMRALSIIAACRGVIDSSRKPKEIKKDKSDVKIQGNA